MFRTNKYQQLKLEYPVAMMPKYLVEILEKGWAEEFKKHIYPKINEEKFSLLFSEKNIKTKFTNKCNNRVIEIKRIFQSNR
ncbi:hypothetical protein [Haliovirga abyssi]|uniref:Uncharacterized protein n=1 Tax=Haliovirga abyssi TaxID=2996794 RepID=A0AAU9DV84_9FUSO|nr:hypothetical protein [Haliovirga abyssi]BDU51249.1 hypothetical protein HLVA_18180 [Haliovirga abyssi]